MAIFHLSVKTFSRSKGQSATASVAYRAGAKIKCEREGRTHDYTRKGDVLHSEIFLPDNAPDWANDRQKLWNEAEKAEKRKNSTVAREFEVALPYELNEKQRISLVQDFAKQIVKRHGCVVDAHLHDDSRKVKANHHAHIMLTTRKLEQDGFTKKTRELDQKQSGEVAYWREQWAKTANEHLRNNGVETYIDHRSLKEQGLEREPTIKMGVYATALERKGVKTDRGNYNRAVKAYDPDKINKHLIVQFKQAQELHNKLQFIKRRLPEVKRDIADKQPKLYQAFDDMGILTALPEEKTLNNEQPEHIIDSLQKKLSIDEKRNLINSFNKHIAQKSEKLLSDSLKQIREDAKLLFTEIEKIKSEEPLFFRKKEWQQKLDSKVEQYNKIKMHHDQLKAQGITKEIRTDALRSYYLERPEVYDSIQVIDKEIREYDKEQAKQEVEQQQEKLEQMREQRGRLSIDKDINR